MNRKPSRSRIQDWFYQYKYVIPFLMVGLATLLFLPGREYFAKGQWALLYLLLIVFTAIVSGIRAALLASILSFIAWNYFFLPPFHTLLIADPKDWLFLIVFLLVGIIMGLQTGRLREREAEALAREREASLLNRFSAHLLSELTIEEMSELLIKALKDNIQAGYAILFIPDPLEQKLRAVRIADDTLEPIDPEIIKLVEWSYREAKAMGLPYGTKENGSRPEGWPISLSLKDAGFASTGNIMVLPFQTPAQRIGVIYIGERVNRESYSLDDARLLVALANQSTLFLERKLLQGLAVQAHALLEADRLKSTLISSISHEFKTPLASLTATITNLLEGDMPWDETMVRDELEAVKADLARLNNSISALVDLSRLETSAWEPKMDWYELGEILGTTLSKLPEKSRSRVTFRLAEDLPQVWVDFTQISRVLQILLENALIYSGGDSPVKVGGSMEGKDIRIWVEDAGPGIPADERTKIFDKFYRGASASKSPSGTGLGLAIASEIIKTHHGKIWVEDVMPHGTRMVITLPKEGS